MPDTNGAMTLDRHVDAARLYDETAGLSAAAAAGKIDDAVRACAPDVAEGMARLIAHLVGIV